MNGTIVVHTDAAYPMRLHALLGANAPAQLAMAGNADLLQMRTLSLFCSVRCPGTMILYTYEFMRRVRHRRLAFVSGFHSPMERECMRTLASGTAGVVWCIAKALSAFRLPPEWEPLLQENRLLILAPFADTVTRITDTTSRYRNRIAAALADDAFFSYAAPGGRTERFCMEVMAWEKTVFTLDAIENTGIIERGAHALTRQDIDSFWPADGVEPSRDGLV